MTDNNEYDDEWIEDAPVYRSLSIAPPDDLAQPSFDSANSTTYDGDEEQTVYRSLCVQAPMAPPSLGGLPMPGDLGMGMMSLNQKSSLYGEPTINPQLKHPAPMNAPPKSLDAASLQLSGVPISTSFLDPCHVYVYGDPAQIVHQINQELDDSGIDYVFKSQKAKWKCVGYEFGQHIDFRVRLYSAQKEQGFPLEFQRRQGPLLQFNRVYQQIVYKLSLHKFVRDQVSKPAPTISPPKLALADPEILEAGIGRLVDMARSSREDGRHQALVTLTKFSPKEEYQPALTKKENLETVVGYLTASSHVSRCAVTILADVCETEQHRMKVAEAMGLVGTNSGTSSRLDVLFAMAAKYQNAKETSRQSWRLMAKLTMCCDAEVLQHASGNQTVLNLVAEQLQTSDAVYVKELVSTFDKRGYPLKL